MNEFKYEDVNVGDVFKTQLSLSKELVSAYRKVLDWPDGGEKKAPPAVFANFKPWDSAFGGRPAQGTVHLRQRMEHYGEVRVGDGVDVTVRIQDKYSKKGRDYLVFETEFANAGELCCRALTTLLWAYAQ